MCDVYCTGYNLIQSGDPIELNFKGLEMKHTNRKSHKVNRKMGSFVYLSCLFIELWILCFLMITEKNL